MAKTALLTAELNYKNNSSSCTMKISNKSKISTLNGKAVNVNTTSSKVNLNSAMSEADGRVPTKLPKVVHPVPPPVNTKPTLVTVEPKRPTNFSNGQILFSNCQRVSVDRSVPVCSATERNSNDCHPSYYSLSSHSSSSLNSNLDSRDINELLNYIKSNKSVDKAALAQKKAAKKTRQRLKKVQEREQAEIEQLKEEIREEKHKEMEQLAEKQKIKKTQEDKMHQRQDSKKNGKKKSKNGSENAFIKESANHSNLIEETIPAMVTIKRVDEGSNSSTTVTITLKGSTPESDKLQFTLVNEHHNKEHIATAIINTDNKAIKSKADSTIKLYPQNIISKTVSTDNTKNAKRKKKKETNDIAAKELKVTIAVDKNNVSKKDSKSNKALKVSESKALKNNKEAENKTSQSLNSFKDDINQLMLRLSPGITITKIEGPPTNRNCKASTDSASAEKLTQQSITANNNKNKKKNKKKRDKKIGNSETDGSFINKTNQNGSGSPMVTLKNPLFHPFNKVVENCDLPVFQNNQQASILKNENGMVTIRSPRLQNPLENGSPISNFLSDLKPMCGPEVPSSYVPMCHTNSESSKKLSFNMEEILSSLPGIEITKVDKISSKNKPENKKPLQPAEVSIIRTSTGANGADKFTLDEDDWPFESVFTPRDDLEEDINAEDQQLEAFKRFCQQSVSPECKEKVAHLNAKDIILKKKKKKKDVSY